MADAEVLLGIASAKDDQAVARATFFPADVAEGLIRELCKPGVPLAAEVPIEKARPVPNLDMPGSRSLKAILTSAARYTNRNGIQTIEPVHLLAAIVEDTYSLSTQLLRQRGITRQKLAKTLKRSNRFR